jgi:hypothetical protein
MKNILTKRKQRNCFTKEEDEAICEFYKTKGTKRWTDLILPSRSARQIRERWKHVLNPVILKKAWTLDEDNRLIEKVEEFGKKRAYFLQFFPGRTDVILKNRHQLLMRHKKAQKKITYEESNKIKFEEQKEDLNQINHSFNDECFADWFDEMLLF